MPRYFLNLRFGPRPSDIAFDNQGDDLPDNDAARDYALQVARDLAVRSASHRVRDWFACSFEITDETGTTVLAVPFSDTVSDEDARAR